MSYRLFLLRNSECYKFRFSYSLFQISDLISVVVKEKKMTNTPEKECFANNLAAHEPSIKESIESTASKDNQKMISCHSHTLTQQEQGQLLQVQVPQKRKCPDQEGKICVSWTDELQGLQRFLAAGNSIVDFKPVGEEEEIYYSSLSVLVVSSKNVALGRPSESSIGLQPTESADPRPPLDWPEPPPPPLQDI